MKQTKKNFEITTNLQTIVNVYNNREHSSLNGLSPKKYSQLSENSETRLKPTYQSINVDSEKSITNNGEFNFEKNKSMIDKKMKLAEQKFPILSCVKMSTKKTVFLKSSKSEKFTLENYFVFRIKRPLFSSEPVTYILCDLRGRLLKGHVYEHELKRVPFNNFSAFKIIGLKERYIEKTSGKVKFIVNLANFPKDLLFDLNKSDLAKLSMSNEAIKQFNNFL